jgi:hypothetical protein
MLINSMLFIIVVLFDIKFRIFELLNEMNLVECLILLLLLNFIIQNCILNTQVNKDDDSIKNIFNSFLNDNYNLHSLAIYIRIYILYIYICVCVCVFVCI